MTQDILQASLSVPEVSLPSSTPTPTIYTPPSEDSSPLHIPFTDIPSPRSSPLHPSSPGVEPQGSSRAKNREPPSEASQFAVFGEGTKPDLDSTLDSDEGEEDMPDRPTLHRPTDGRSQVALLKDERGRPSYDSPNGSARPAFAARRSTFRSRSPDFDAKTATRRKYTYAAFFLLLSLVSFVIQTETAKRKTPWKAFWRRHVYILRTTAQMVESQDLHLKSRESHKSPVPYILRTTAITTMALTIAGGSWYVAVDLTSASDLTAIYNCSAFFAYAFSIPLLRDKIRFDKVFSVVVAIAGVLIVAYGDSAPTKHGGKSGGSVGGDPYPDGKVVRNKTAGNIIIGIGSILYGLYEVLYKKLACPPEGTSPGRGMTFAMTFGSLIGCFTLFVLWIPLPILHIMKWEVFELPRGEAAWMLLISVLANAS
ncbi:MAG: hypothetical protein Q9187_004085, partial [Circinaria calcarea]